MSQISIWYILLAVLVFGVLIFIHELGHFISARLCGVEIKEFSIGMGPKIFGWTSSNNSTDYSLRLIPLGGYVSMVGEDEDSDSENSFNKKTVWQRLLIVAAGPIMNLVLGFIVTVVMVNMAGNLYSNVIYYTNDTVALSQSYGLESGDRITKIGSAGVHTWHEVSYEIMNRGYEPIDITVKRNGEKILIEDVVFPTIEESGAVFGQVDFIPKSEPNNLGNILKHSFWRSVSTVKMVIDSFVDLLRGRYGMDAVSGPVGITQTIGDFAALGFYYFLYIVAVITINLGVFNLFPVPGLDGGRLLFLVIEGALGHPLNRKIEGYINLVGLVIMFGLAILITFNDILRLF